MNNKSKIITASLSILIVVLYILNEKYDYGFDEALKGYQIYLDGKETVSYTHLTLPTIA